MTRRTNSGEQNLMDGGRRRQIQKTPLKSVAGPLYDQIRKFIEDAIRSGSLSAGDALPPERSLAVGAGVSRVTVRRGVQKLIESGLLIHRQGSGTFVAEQPERFEATLSSLLTTEEPDADRGKEISSVLLERGHFDPSREEAMLFGLFAGDRVIRLSWVRYLGAKPVAIEQAVVPARFLPNPELVEGPSVYAALSSAKIGPTRARQRLRATELWEQGASLLGTSPGAAALQIERISYLDTGAAVERTISTYRGDRYDFLAETEPAER